MKFYEIKLLYDALKKNIPNFSLEWWRARCTATRLRNQYIVETGFMQLGRPYYNVWPGIVDSLLRLDLNKVPCDAVRFPIPRCAFRFPPGILQNMGNDVQSALVSYDPHPNGQIHFMIWYHCGEYNEFEPIYTYCATILESGKTVQDVIGELPIDLSYYIGDPVDADCSMKLIKLIVAFALLFGDSELVEPDVLNADQIKWDQTGDMKYVDRAIRRGKKGWHIGKNIEYDPHVRAACPAALYWTGKGKLIPIIRFRKGCIVKRQKVKDVHFGRIDSNDMVS